MMEVVAPGLETSIQELPGRIGFWEQGFPPSGPVDTWSFRLANLLVGNDRDAAALECQFLGPTLKFQSARRIAVTGADMAPTLDDAPLPAWTTVSVEPGQVLAVGAARTGARAYIAVSGGIDTPPVLGSRATFHMAGVGGIGGYALKTGQRIPLAPASAGGIWTVRDDCRPVINGAKRWMVEAMRGPNDDWLDEPAIERFFGSDWTVQAKSSRTGIRLTGPEFSFSRRAYDKRPEHGQDPSNILDHGYPFGAVNLAGQTPIILINDSPSTGGFINPFTVVTAAFWKLGQARPWDVFRFAEVSLDNAYELRRRLDRVCTSSSLARMS